MQYRLWQDPETVTARDPPAEAVTARDPPAEAVMARDPPAEAVTTQAPPTNPRRLATIPEQVSCTL